MTMKLAPSDKLAPLLDTYPGLVDFLAGFSPKFDKLRNRSCARPWAGWRRSTRSPGWATSRSSA
jgi:hypothetical protein